MQEFQSSLFLYQQQLSKVAIKLRGRKVKKLHLWNQLRPTSLVTDPQAGLRQGETLG